MNSKKALTLLIIVNSINSVFFSFEKVETIILSIVFVVIAILIILTTKAKSKLFFVTAAISLIIVQTILFIIISDANNNEKLNRTLKTNIINNSKWEWNLDNVNYSISVKNDSISFYDENELIDVFFFKIDDNKIYFNSITGEYFMWELVNVDNNQLKIIEDNDVLSLSKMKMKESY